MATPKRRPAKSRAGAKKKSAKKRAAKTRPGTRTAARAALLRRLDARRPALPWEERRAETLVALDTYKPETP